MASTSPITTHVLDTVTGRPARGLAVTLSRRTDAGWERIAGGTTNDDGRIADWLSGQPREAGTYKVDFDTGAWFEQQQRPQFYPEVSIVFTLEQPDEHYHIPLLLSDHGYTTYRGS